MNPNTHRLTTLVRPLGVGASPCRGGKGVSCARDRICTALSARAPWWGRAYLSDATLPTGRRFTGSASRVPSRSSWQMGGVDHADLLVPPRGQWKGHVAPLFQLRRSSLSPLRGPAPFSEGLSQPLGCHPSVPRIPGTKRACQPVPLMPLSTPIASIVRLLVALQPHYYGIHSRFDEVLHTSALLSCNRT